MLPTALVTLVTFLLEVCSTSPVYNMQPAFITNTVGSTSGRNIRNLPCISRRNSNQSGYCMFAIDCLKANGTHLGTCIDGFYFGSCCHIEPVRDIVDNTIDSDIIPHREPPFRISSTTAKTIVSSTQEPTTLKNSLSSSTTIKHDIGVTSSTSSSIKPIISSTVGQKVTTTTSTTTAATMTSTSSAPTTVAEKMQTFQIVESNTLETKTTISPAVSTSTVSARPLTKEPTFISSTTTRAPVSSSRTTTKEPPILSSITTKSPSKPTKISTVSTTEKTKTTTTARPTINFVSTTKPTKAPPTKTTQKPTKSTRPSITTKKPQTTTKTSTTKPTKYASSTSKPTKRVATTSEKPTTLKTTASTEKQATKPATTTIKQHETSTVSVPPTSISTASHIQSTDEKSTTESLEVINGNLATNEINDDQHIIQGSSQPTTNKPELITWTISSNINTTTTSPTTQNVNVTTEDWVPITTPDGWVLLPNVLSNETNSNDTSLDAASKQNSSESSASTMVPPVSPITLPTPFDKPTESVTGMASSSTSPPIIDGGEGLVTSNETMLENATITNTLSTESFDKPVNMSDFTDVCGRRMYPEARIVGGEKSSFGRWPWQISLRQWRTSTYLHKCGAALLNENWAITAAHCVDNVAPSDLLLRLGEHDLSTESEPYLHQERRVQIVASHPQFDPRTFEYDLALLRFYEPVNFQPNILPVCVPQTDESFVGKTAFVTGWGRLYEDGPLPSILQEVSVPVINNTVCESMYRAAGYIELIPHIFICAGWKRGGFDSCEGDSGGPMVIQRKDNRFLLAGVISWGIGCAEPNQPGVYTRISEFRDWINQILQF